MAFTTSALWVLATVLLTTHALNVFDPDVIKDLVGKTKFSKKEIDYGVDQLKEFLLSRHSQGDDSWPPKFCNKLQCPKFTVVDKQKEYEVREYEMSSWVTTGETGVDYEAATSKMFMRLFDYISGQNAKSEKIAMTAPVINLITPGPGAACADNFTMSFFLGQNGMTMYPAPSNKLVSRTSLPKIQVYVRQFGGRPDIKEWLAEGVKLAQALPKGAKYDTKQYYTAGYDSPFKLLDRHNEIWFLKQD